MISWRIFFCNSTNRNKNFYKTAHTPASFPDVITRTSWFSWTTSSQYQWEKKEPAGLYFSHKTRYWLTTGCEVLIEHDRAAETLFLCLFVWWCSSAAVKCLEVFFSISFSRLKKKKQVLVKAIRYLIPRSLLVTKQQWDRKWLNSFKRNALDTSKHQ